MRNSDVGHGQVFSGEVCVSEFEQEPRLTVVVAFGRLALPQHMPVEPATIRRDELREGDGRGGGGGGGGGEARRRLRVDVLDGDREVHSWTVTGGEAESHNVGRGWLEPPRPWLGAQWAGLSPWARRAAHSRKARREEAQEPSWRAAKTALCPCWRAGGAEGVGVRAEVEHEGEHRDDLSHRSVELADAEIRPART